MSSARNEAKGSATSEPEKVGNTNNSHSRSLVIVSKQCLLPA